MLQRNNQVLPEYICIGLISNLFIYFSRSATLNLNLLSKQIDSGLTASGAIWELALKLHAAK